MLDKIDQNMSDTSLPLLEIKDLECIRDDRELFTALSFSLGQGEVLQIEGPNGSGKTSLLRIVCGLRLPDSGEVHWCGEDIRGNREDYYARMVYLGHLPCIKGDLNVMENIRVLLDTRSMVLPDDDVGAALYKVGRQALRMSPARPCLPGNGDGCCWLFWSWRRRTSGCWMSP